MRLREIRRGIYRAIAEREELERRTRTRRQVCAHGPCHGTVTDPWSDFCEGCLARLDAAFTDPLP